MSDSEAIPAHFITYGGGETSPVSVDAYFNSAGLISIRIDDEHWLELSPTSARELVARLNVAMKDSVAALLSPEE